LLNVAKKETIWQCFKINDGYHKGNRILKGTLKITFFLTVSKIQYTPEFTRYGDAFMVKIAKNFKSLYFFIIAMKETSDNDVSIKYYFNKERFSIENVTNGLQNQQVEVLF